MYDSLFVGFIWLLLKNCLIVIIIFMVSQNMGEETKRRGPRHDTDSVDLYAIGCLDH